MFLSYRVLHDCVSAPDRGYDWDLYICVMQPVRVWQSSSIRSTPSTDRLLRSTHVGTVKGVRRQLDATFLEKVVQ